MYSTCIHCHAKLGANEETECQALETEEIAAIADNLLIPTPVRELLARHLRTADAEPV